MRTRSIVTSLAAVLASASFLVSETQATTFTGTAYYTDFASPRVNKVDYFYDNVTHTFTMSAPTLVTTLNGADGIVFAPNSSLLVGGQGTGFMYNVTPGSPATVTSASTVTASFHLALAPNGLSVYTSAFSGPLVNGNVDDIAPLSGLGSQTNTPLPAALPLFASGAGVLGYFGWRRKRKKATAAVH